MYACRIECIKLLFSCSQISLSVMNIRLGGINKIRIKLCKKQLYIAVLLVVFLLVSNVEQGTCHTLIKSSEMKSSLLEI